MKRIYEQKLLAFPKNIFGLERFLVGLPSLLDTGALTWTRLHILIFSSNLTTVLRLLPQTGQTHRACAQRATGKLVAMVI